MTRLIACAMMSLLLGACYANVSPVPVRGTVDQLVGEWEGRYRSGESGREGSILFRLDPGKDTATGDVLMTLDRYPAATHPERMDDPWVRSAVHVLRINLVRCDRDEVSGWMKPYLDPDTGELMYTDFEGLIRGDTLSGTYVAYGEASGRRSSGTWSVIRKRPRS
jgi:hypothetical protein